MHSLSVLLEKPLEIRLGDGEKPSVENVLQITKTHPRDRRDLEKERARRFYFVSTTSSVVARALFGSRNEQAVCLSLITCCHSFPNTLAFGFSLGLAEEGAALAVTQAGQGQESSLEAEGGVISLSRGGSKGTEPSSSESPDQLLGVGPSAPSQRALGCRGPVNCTVMAGSSAEINMCFEFSK